MDVYTARDEVKARLEKARADAALIPELERQLEGFESFIALNEAEANGEVLEFPKPPIDEDSAPDEEDEELPIFEVSRPEAIVRILQDSRKGLAPAEIAAALNRAGRPNDTPHNVSTALARLRKRGRVRSRGYGRWTLVRPHPPVEGTGETRLRGQI